MDDFIGFWKTKDKYGQFSNWFHAEFDMDDIHFKNSEQAFMYLKAKLFNDTIMMDKILSNSNPMMDKKYGRMVKPFDGEVFDKHKYQMMVDVNYHKFSQNEALRDLLLSTGDATLVEASSKDRIWAIGMTVDDPDFVNPSKWKGLNLLGEALMEVREKLKQDCV